MLIDKFNLRINRFYFLVVIIICIFYSTNLFALTPLTESTNHLILSYKIYFTSLYSKQEITNSFNNLGIDDENIYDFDLLDYDDFVKFHRHLNHTSPNLYVIDLNVTPKFQKIPVLEGIKFHFTSNTDIIQTQTLLI